MISDREVIEKVITGEKEMFRLIIERYKNQVSATIAGMIGVDHSFDDLGQQVFVRMYKSIHQFQFNSSVGTYLTRIAINLSLNEIRRRKRFRDRFVAILDDADYTDHLSESETFVREDIQKHLCKLSENYRATVVLRYLHEYSNTESAEILGIPEGSFRTRLSRALLTLRQSIEEEKKYE